MRDAILRFARADQGKKSFAFEVEQILLGNSRCVIQIAARQNARKLCADLVAAEPLGEIVALVKDCFSHLVATPHLVVRINDELYDSAREKIERLAKQSGFEGRLVILAEPEIATGDCRIEWADGGVVLERGAIAAKIDEMVGRYIASRRGS